MPDDERNKKPSGTVPKREKSDSPLPSLHLIRGNPSEEEIEALADLICGPEEAEEIEDLLDELLPHTKGERTPTN